MKIRKIIAFSLGTILIIGLFNRDYKLQKNKNFIIPEKTKVVYSKTIDKTRKLKKC